MADEFPTEDDINKMYHQHLKDEFARNGESIAEKKEDFKRQLREARGEQPAVIRQETKPANDNKKQPQQNEGLNNSHNSGQGQKTDKPKDKAAEKQRFKDLLAEARGEQRTRQEKEFGANDKDVSGSRENQRHGEVKVNGRDITKKSQEPKDKGGKYTPQPPTPNRDFTRTFGRDRDRD